MKKISFLTALLCMIVFISATSASAKMRIAILEFSNNTPNASESVARAITDMFTTELANSNSFSVYERAQLESIAAEQKLSASGLVDSKTAIQLGKIAGVQMVILGAITEFTETKSAGVIPIPYLGGIATGNNKAKVTLDVRVINTTTGEITLAMRESGLADHAAGGVMLYGVTFAEGQHGGILSAATQDAVRRVSSKLRRIVGGENSYVVGLSGNGATIDVGAMQGAKPGSLFAVYKEGSAVKGINGEILGMEKHYFAVLKVTEAESAYSKTSVAKGKVEDIRKGDFIESVSAGEMKKLELTSYRPAGSSDALKVLGSSGDSVSTQSPAQPVDSASTAPVSASALMPKTAGGIADMSDKEEVILTYPLDKKQINNLSILFRGGLGQFRSGKNEPALKIFTQGVQEYLGHYLSAYWAGRVTHKMGKKADSLQWMNRALKINPNYKPAKEFKANNFK